MTTQRLPSGLWIIVILNLGIAIFSLVFNLSSGKQIVYVDAIRLISKYKGMDAARAELNLRSQTWKANLDTLRNEAALAIRNYEQNKGTASAHENRLTEELIKSKQDQFLHYEQSIKEQYQKQDQEISSRLLAKVNDYLKRYGEQSGYTIILAATHYGNIAYADKSLDITEEVLEGLNKEYLSTPK